MYPIKRTRSTKNFSKLDQLQTLVGENTLRCQIQSQQVKRLDTCGGRGSLESNFKDFTPDV